MAPHIEVMTNPLIKVEDIEWFMNQDKPITNIKFGKFNKYIYEWLYKGNLVNLYQFVFGYKELSFKVYNKKNFLASIDCSQYVFEVCRWNKTSNFIYIGGSMILDGYFLTDNIKNSFDKDFFTDLIELDDTNFMNKLINYISFDRFNFLSIIVNKLADLERGDLFSNGNLIDFDLMATNPKIKRANKIQNHTYKRNEKSIVVYQMGNLVLDVKGRIVDIVLNDNFIDRYMKTKEMFLCNDELLKELIADVAKFVFMGRKFNIAFYVNENLEWVDFKLSISNKNSALYF